MRLSVRRDAIVDIVEKQKQVTVEDLAAQLAASKETIRRDLASLDSDGLIQKYHGGAKARQATDKAAIGEGRFKTRLMENREAKRLIARAAASLFSNGDTLFIDTGSTTVLFADELAKLSDLTVITNSTMIAATLARAEQRHHVYLIGGEFSADASESVGALAVEQIKRFNAQHVVLTVGAVQDAGILDFDLKEAEIAQSMIEQAQTVTVLADHSKFGRAAVFNVARLETIDRIVTDSGLPADVGDALGKANVEVIVASPGDPELGLSRKMARS